MAGPPPINSPTRATTTDTSASRNTSPQQRAALLIGRPLFTRRLGGGVGISHPLNHGLPRLIPLFPARLPRESAGAGRRLVNKYEAIKCKEERLSHTRNRGRSASVGSSQFRSTGYSLVNLCNLANIANNARPVQLISVTDTVEGTCLSERAETRLLLLTW